jgi:hypothetical protein
MRLARSRLAAYGLMRSRLAAYGLMRSCLAAYGSDAFAPGRLWV